MSQSFKWLAVLGTLGLVAACQPAQEEVVYIQPEPISVEPVYTGKYK